MYDYSRLPTLVLNEIFGYLSVKERIKCKSVCRIWKTEVELKEKNRDLLILHFGPYLWNLKWSPTNNGGLMKFENSFTANDQTILHPLARSQLKKIKKLAIVNYHNCYDPAVVNINECLGRLNEFHEIEIIELRNFGLPGETLTFELPNLKRLAIRDSPLGKLVLECPSLEVLFQDSHLNEIQFKSIKKLKSFICFGWPAKVSLDDGKFDSLEYFNLFAVDDERINDRLLDLMPKLKKFVLYSSDPQADLAVIREQQKRYGLNELEVLFSGFSEPIKVTLCRFVSGYVGLDACTEQLFDNYTKLVENSHWKCIIDYSSLFNKFKVLPVNFFERFPEPNVIEIGKVTSYTHLFEFLRCYPFVDHLRLHFSKTNANLILDFMHLLQPSLRELAFVEERAADLLDIDLSFIRLFELVCLTVISTHLPVSFIQEVAAKRGSKIYPRGILFETIDTFHQLMIYFYPDGFGLFDVSCGSRFEFDTLEQLISSMQNDPHLKTLLLD